jgi:ABC-type transporter Mla MlaB component
MSFGAPAGLSSRTTGRGKDIHGLADLIFGGPIARDEVNVVCERALALLERREVDPVVCQVGALDPDAVTIDVLARVQLTARRQGRRIELDGVSAELRELLVFVGLVEVLPLVAALGVEPRGQPEEREQSLGVEEEADPGDRAV